MALLLKIKVVRDCASKQRCVRCGVRSPRWWLFCWLWSSPIATTYTHACLLQKLTMLPLSLAVFNNCWRCFSKMFSESDLMDDSVVSNLKYTVRVALGWALMTGRDECVGHLNQAYEYIVTRRKFTMGLLPGGDTGGTKLAPLTKAGVRQLWDVKGGDGNVRTRVHSPGPAACCRGAGVHWY